MPEPRFNIGQQFHSHGKAPRLCTVVDILRTYNSAGDLVRVRYVATHDLMGQTVTDSDVTDTAIAMRAIRTMFVSNGDGTEREVYVCDRSPVMGTEDRMTYALAGEAYDVFRHVNHTRWRIARIYHTGAPGNRKWQVADRNFNEICRSGSLRQGAIFAYSRAKESIV